mmetsp:Transcript_107290/g.308667  ORF Transcript_107290/g.308667 Transcript_107290/m.308667 type:complete len:316 (+) Transcript_107290:111-1058(+)
MGGRFLAASLQLTGLISSGAAALHAEVSSLLELFFVADDECAADEGACGLSALQRRVKGTSWLDGPTADGGLHEEAADRAAVEAGPAGSEVSEETPPDDAPAPSAEQAAEAGGVDESSSEPPAPQADINTAAPESVRGVAMLGCRGPWCDTVNNFNALFDTNDPAMMQRAVDTYSEWPAEDTGIAVAVTKDHYYEMYHGNVKSKLSEFLPQGMFGWSFGDEYKVFQEPTGENGREGVLVRSGTVTFALGWFRRGMFWNAVVKPTPDGWTFPFSTLDEFGDCNKCAAELIYTLKKGGLTGQGDYWAIVGLAVVKLA